MYVVECKIVKWDYKRSLLIIFFVLLLAVVITQVVYATVVYNGNLLVGSIYAPNSYLTIGTSVYSNSYVTIGLNGAATPTPTSGVQLATQNVAWLFPLALAMIGILFSLIFMKKSSGIKDLLLIFIIIMIILAAIGGLNGMLSSLW